MIEILHFTILFVAKVIDNMLGTAKTIFIQRNKAWLAAVFLMIADIIYYAVVKEVASTDGNATILVVAIASGVGCWLAIKINNKLSKDRIYAHIIMSDDLSAMKQFRDFLATNHITNIATDSYTLDWMKKTISITAYAKTKAESSLIDNYINDSNRKFKRLVQKI